MNSGNYYQVLGVSPSASLEKIKAAYRQRLDSLRQQIHSENHPDGAFLGDLRLAYATLSDPAARAAYDASNTTHVPPAISVPPAKAEGDAPGREGFRFTGQGAEYFRIWIVNFFLSLLTLGIYSAWAKVRREQYFHRNLLLDGSGFDYHAEPKAILKGRIVAFLLLMGISAASRLGEGVHLLALAAFSVALPWLVIRTFRFRAINTSYRGLRFGFEASYGEAFKVFVGYGLLIPLSLGLAFPLYYRQVRKFLIDHLRFGTTRFSSELGIGTIYRIFLMPGVMAIATAVVFFGAFSLLKYGGAHSSSKMLLGILVALTPMVFFVVTLAYLAASTANAVWSSTSLGPHRFSCKMPVGAYLKLSLVNWLGILFTLGLFIPWARIRMAHFRAAHLSLTVNGSLEDFVAAELSKTSAIGDETAEMFDLDIAL